MSATGQNTKVALVADDDRIVRDLLRSLLTKANYLVVCAASGNEALSYAPQMNAALAILDLDMPDGNGIEATVALRRLPNWQKVPILILTSYHTDKALIAARRAGATGFLCKPFVPSQLLRRIADLAGTGIAEQATADASADAPADAATGAQLAAASNERLDQQRALLQVYRNVPSRRDGDPSPAMGDDDDPPRHRRILVADDDELTRDVVTGILTQAGYLTHSAEDGQGALAAVIADEYDMVLMDVRMPVLDGAKTTRLIRSLPGTKRLTPIIAMTANNFQRFTRELIDAGMNGYLTKPIRGDSLLACIREHLPPLPADQPARTLELDRFYDAVDRSPPGAMARLLDELADLINEIMPGLQGWVTVTPAELNQRLRSLAGIAETIGCTALCEDARAINAQPAPTDTLRQQFVATARATLAAVRPYRT